MALLITLRNIMSVGLSVGQQRLHGLLKEPQMNKPVSPALQHFVSRVDCVMDHAELYVALGMAAILGLAMLPLFVDIDLSWGAFCISVFVMGLIGAAVAAVYSTVEDNCRHVSAATMDTIFERCKTLKKSRNKVDKQLADAIAPFVDGCGGEWKASWLESLSRAVDVRCAELQQTASAKPRKTKTPKGAAVSLTKPRLQL